MLKRRKKTFEIVFHFTKLEMKERTQGEKEREGEGERKIAIPRKTKENEREKSKEKKIFENDHFKLRSVGNNR